MSTYPTILIPTSQSLGFSVPVCILSESDRAHLGQFPQHHLNSDYGARSDCTALATGGHILVCQGQHPKNRILCELSRYSFRHNFSMFRLFWVILSLENLTKTDGSLSRKKKSTITKLHEFDGSLDHYVQTQIKNLLPEEWRLHFLAWLPKAFMIWSLRASHPSGIPPSSSNTLS